jgi:hypothetical protein
MSVFPLYSVLTQIPPKDYHVKRTTVLQNPSEERLTARDNAPIVSGVWQARLSTQSCRSLIINGLSSKAGRADLT